MSKTPPDAGDQVMTPPRDLTPEFWVDLACKLNSSPVILDLGSHHLEEAELLIPHLVGATWHGFEPNLDCYRYANGTIASNLSKDHHCTIYMNCCAVGREVGVADLHLSSKKNGEPWTPSSSIRRPTHALEAYPWMAFEKTTPVPVTTLDRYCCVHDIDHVDLLKMDIQGAEIDAIAGGQETLSKTSYLVTEAVDYAEYEGQLSFPELHEALRASAGRWSLVERLVSDAFFINLDRAHI